MFSLIRKVLVCFFR